MLYTTKRVLLFSLWLVLGGAMGCSLFQASSPPEGSWDCKATWSQKNDAGEVVESSSVQEATCEDHVLKVRGLISIGDAQWKEAKEGTCYASGDELYGQWTTVQTTPENDAARQFEKERFGGQSLALASKAVEHEHRVRVTSRTDTELRAVNGDGQVVHCARR